MTYLVTSADLTLGCNSSYFASNRTSLCEEIGGKYNASLHWCEAANKESVMQMLANVTNSDSDMDLICKTGYANETESNDSQKTIVGPKAIYHFGFMTMLVILLTLVASIQSVSIPHSLETDYQLPNLTIRDRPQPCIKHVEKVGNGDPHPSCKFHQVTGNLDCNHQDCQSSHAEGRTFSWSVAGTGGGPFATLGFDVSEDYSSESTYSCSPKDGHQKVCVIAVVSYTEYTAKEIVSSGDCLGTIHSTPYVIRAPDKGHRQNFRCEVDAGCVELDHEVWEHNGQPCP
jgi:hypothetical protein